MSKILKSDYQLEDGRMSPDDIRMALKGDFEGFKYFFSHCCQLQDKNSRQLIHPTLNKGQEMIAKTLLRYISKDTREDRHRECIILGPRQFGKSTSITAISDYMLSYVPGCERINLVHTLHTGGAASKYCSQKIIPIVTGVRPDIFPTIARDNIQSSTLLTFKDVKGIRRDSIYEVVSAGSNSVRSGTVTVWLADEPSEYRNPEAVEDAISGAIGDYGFSFTAYIGTFSDRIGPYFLDKIKTAIDHPEEMELVFIPWFLVYGRKGDGRNINLNELSDYEKDVIIPEMIKNKIPTDEFADKIGWYRRRALRTANMRYEFPTSIEDILSLTADKCVFSEESIEKQKENIMAGTPYRIITDNITGKVEAQKTDFSPFRIFKPPLYGHRYKLVVDPITATNEDTDFFAMNIFDESNLEQVAVFYGRDMPIEDYADYAVSMAKLYNNALICPESNVADAFVVLVRALKYYYFYYPTPQARAKREPGIRTTVSSKEAMIDKLKVLLDSGRIILHDEETVEQLGYFEKQVKGRSDGGQSVRMAARRGKHDDLVSCFSGETKITTNKGQRRIKDIEVGDFVLTSRGYRKVEGVSTKYAPVIDKFGIRATPNHKFITPSGNQEWRNINIHDKVYSCTKFVESTREQSNTKGKGITGTQNLRGETCESTISDIRNGKSLLSRSIESFMRKISVQFRKAITSIIKTATQKTMTQVISRLSQEKSTCVWKVVYDGPTLNTEGGEKKSSILQRVRRNVRMRRKIAKQEKEFVHYVKKSLCPGITAWSLLFALRVARCGILTRMDFILLKESKSNGSVEWSFHIVPTMKHSCEGSDFDTVYNLQVSDVHEYYANNILVHNCLWIYAGTLDQRQFNGLTEHKVTIL